jgi:hypothetical protein
MRTVEGEVLAALSYSHIYGRILIEADLVTPKQEEFHKLVEEYRSDDRYGPRPLAPFGSGFTFVDFKTRTIFDAQSIAFFPAFTLPNVIEALFNAPDRFDVYVPHFGSVMETVQTPSDCFEMPEIVERKIEKASNQAELWALVGVETVPGELGRWEDGAVKVVATATVPDGDFEAIMLDLPGWTVKHYDPRDTADMRRFFGDFASTVPLAATDYDAWEEHISQL